MQGHWSQERRYATPPFQGQQVPDRRRQVAHRGIQANAPSRKAPGTRFSVFRSSSSNYQRQCVWDIERTFRTAKSPFETRPIYHQLDATIRGHVACSFLALALKKDLEDRLAATTNGARASWPAVMADLDSLAETEVEQDGKRFLLRSAPRPGASLALKALGVALPPTLRQFASA